MKIKNKSTGTWLTDADLVLEGQDDVERLRRALDAYDRFVVDHEAPYVIPVARPDGDADARV